MRLVGQDLVQLLLVRIVELGEIKLSLRIHFGKVIDVDMAISKKETAVMELRYRLH